jgi:hypothetical protein
MAGAPPRERQAWSTDWNTAWNISRQLAQVDNLAAGINRTSWASNPTPP